VEAQGVTAQRVKHKSLAPWFVALACLGPFAAALLIYYGPWGVEWLPVVSGSRELLRPPVPLPAAWRSREGEAPWQLIYATMRPCEQRCAQHLGRLLQVQLALGRDQDRVGRVVWHVGEPPALEDAALTKLALDDAAGGAIVEALGAERIADGRVFVADPRSDVILSYPPDVEQKELLRDLKRLLAGSGS
jgi:hypothetical protein